MEIWILKLRVLEDLKIFKKIFKASLYYNPRISEFWQLLVISRNSYKYKKPSGIFKGSRLLVNLIILGDVKPSSRIIYKSKNYYNPYS